MSPVRTRVPVSGECGVIPSTISGFFAVIGDVHGHTGPLQSLLENLEESAVYDERWLVFLGDLVDRGPDPRAAVQFVIDLVKNRGKTTCIMGNHEFVLLAALGLYGDRLEREFAQPYLDLYSPEPTFRSYGVEPGDLQGLRRSIPDGHLEFLLSLPWCVEAEGHLVVHAGLLPNEPYDTQLERLRNRETNPGQPWLHAQRLVTAQPPPDWPTQPQM